jgi:hypothetical protein
MNQMETASPPLSLPVGAAQRLRGRPSGLKGRYRDRYATGLRPALDPGASTAPDQTATRAGARRCPPGARRRLTTNQDHIPTTTSLRFQGIASRPGYRYWERSPPLHAGCPQPRCSSRYAPTATSQRHHRTPTPSAHPRRSHCPTPTPGHHWPPHTSRRPHQPSPGPLPRPEQHHHARTANRRCSTSHRTAAPAHTSPAHHQAGPPAQPAHPATWPAVCPITTTTR